MEERRIQLRPKGRKVIYREFGWARQTPRGDSAGRTVKLPFISKPLHRSRDCNPCPLRYKRRLIFGRDLTSSLKALQEGAGIREAAGESTLGDAELRGPDCNGPASNTSPSMGGAALAAATAKALRGMEAVLDGVSHLKAQSAALTPSMQSHETSAANRRLGPTLLLPRATSLLPAAAVSCDTTVTALFVSIPSRQ
ncbi:hypothetical protein Vretifemale_17427, partial [Volvox reticuliferus]